MNTFRHLLLFCLLCIVVAPVSQAQSVASEDGLLNILQQQVDSISHSFPKGEDNVYFLSYRVEKSEQLDMAAAMGSMTVESHTQKSLLTIQIRVGNPKVDNYSVLADGSDEACLYTKTISLPIDDHPELVRKILVRETSAAYREARIRYRQAMVETSDIQKRKRETGDYVHTLPMVYFEPSLTPEEFPVEFLKNKLKACSGAISPHTSLFCKSTLQVSKVRRYFVSSEGASLVENDIHTCLQIKLLGQAKDGAVLPFTKQYDRQLPDELPADEDLVRDVQKMEQVFQPVLNSKSGDAEMCPVVFAESASGVFWQSALVPYLIDYDGSFDKAVLPSDMNIESDPLRTMFGDCRLAGSYQYDDEGTPAERIKLVEAGRLLTSLYSCSDSRDFHFSNGHGRALPGIQPGAAPSNLFVSTTAPHSDEELRALLKKETLLHRCDFGYWVSAAELDSGNVIRPQLVWKIYADGRPDELVHGIEFATTPRMALSQVLAAGNLTYCQKGNYKGISYHCCSVPVLVGQVESRKSQTPQLSSLICTFDYDGGKEEQTESFSEVVLKAMDDEMEAAMDQLKTQNTQTPYYIGYLATDAQVFHVQSSNGVLVTSSESPVRNVETQVLVGGNILNSGRLHGNYGTDFPLDNNYNNIRRCLNNATDKAYKQAVRQMAEKVQALQLLGDSVTMSLPFERTSAWVTNVDIDNPYGNLDFDQLKILANELSLLFSKYSYIINSFVNIDAFRGETYFKASDGVQYAQPLSLIRIEFFGEAVASDGSVLPNRTELFFRDTREIAETSELYHYVSDLAMQLKAMAGASVVTDDFYTGPVLFADEAAVEAFAQAFIENEPNIVASAVLLKIKSGGGGAKSPSSSLESMIDKQIVNRTIDVDAVNTKPIFESTPLIGSFYIDADGVKAEDKFEIIRNGELVRVLTSRMTTGHQEFSNGHLRLALRDNCITAEPGPGVLELSCHQQMNEPQLLKMLCKQARAQGLQYAFVIRKILEIDDQHLIFAQRVNTVSGKSENVCFSCANGLDIFDFQYLTASSKTKKAYNRLIRQDCNKGKNCNESLSGVPSSFIVPEMLYFEKVNLLNVNR